MGEPHACSWLSESTCSCAGRGRGAALRQGGAVRLRTMRDEAGGIDKKTSRLCLDVSIGA
jgi:hypothetical protein